MCWVHLQPGFEFQYVSDFFVRRACLKELTIGQTGWRVFWQYGGRNPEVMSLPGRLILRVFSGSGLESCQVHLAMAPVSCYAHSLLFLWPAPLSFDWSPHLRLTCGPAGNRTTTGYSTGTPVMLTLFALMRVASYSCALVFVFCGRRPCLSAGRT